MRVLQLGEPPSAANGVGEAIAREELAGLAYMFWGRLIVLGMLAVVGGAYGAVRALAAYISPRSSAFALLGAPALSARAARHRRHAGDRRYSCCSMPPSSPTSSSCRRPSTSMAGRRSSICACRTFCISGVFLVGMALSYSPALVLWTGIASIAAWSAGFLWVATLPELASVHFARRTGQRAERGSR